MIAAVAVIAVGYDLAGIVNVHRVFEDQTGAIQNGGVEVNHFAVFVEKGVINAIKAQAINFSYHAAVIVYAKGEAVGQRIGGGPQVCHASITEQKSTATSGPGWRSSSNLVAVVNRIGSTAHAAKADQIGQPTIAVEHGDSIQGVARDLTPVVNAGRNEGTEVAHCSAIVNESEVAKI